MPMSLPATLPISLSAWSYAEAPALVTRLEGAFLNHLAAGLSTTTSVSPETRHSLSSLLRRGAPPRLLGDALYLGQMLGWVERRNRQLGAGTIQVKFVGPEDIFRSFPNWPQSPRRGDLAQKKKEFLKGFDGLDTIARALPQIEGPASAFLRPGDELMTGGYATYLSPLFRPLGIHFFNFADICDADLNTTLVFRHLSLSALEMGLRIYAGENAARLCMAPGFVTEPQNNELHKRGYHPVGFPFRSRIVHGARQRTPIFVLHDAGHAAQWSLRVPAWMRLASALLQESVRKRAGEARKSQKVVWATDALGDLELGVKADLNTAKEDLKSNLPPDVYARVMRDWSFRLEKAGRLLREHGIENFRLVHLADSARFEGKIT